VTYGLCFQWLEKPPYIGGLVLGAGGRKGSGRLEGLPDGKGSGARRRPHCGHQAVAALRAAAVSCLCAAFIGDRGAVQATIWAALFVWGQPRASLCDRRRSARPAGRSQTKLNRAQYSGISAIEDYKPVMQRWSSQRQRYRPCPDAPGWPAISSCSPGARQPRASLRERRSSYAANRPRQPKNKSSVVICHLPV